MELTARGLRSILITEERYGLRCATLGQVTNVRNILAFEIVFKHSCGYAVQKPNGGCATTAYNISSPDGSPRLSHRGKRVRGEPGPHIALGPLFERPHRRFRLHLRPWTTPMSGAARFGDNLHCSTQLLRAYVVAFGRTGAKSPCTYRDRRERSEAPRSRHRGHRGHGGRDRCPCKTDLTKSIGPMCARARVQAHVLVVNGNIAAFFGRMRRVSSRCRGLSTQYPRSYITQNMKSNSNVCCKPDTAEYASILPFYIYYTLFFESSVCLGFDAVPIISLSVRMQPF